MRKATTVLAALLAFLPAYAAAPKAVGAPTIISAPVSGADTYGEREIIRFQVTFDKPVRLVGKDTDLQLEIKVGSENRTAYVRGRAFVLRTSFEFHYSVYANEQLGYSDFDGNGVAIGRNALSLSLGAFMQDEDGATCSPRCLEHEALPDQPGHKVDASRKPDVRYRFSASSTVPDGITVDATTGQVSGTTTEPGTHFFEVEAYYRASGEVIATQRYTTQGQVDASNRDDTLRSETTPAACTVQESPYSAMTDWPFAATWNPAAYEPYRFLTDVERDASSGGIYTRTMQSGSLTAHLKVHDGWREAIAGEVIEIVARVLANVPSVLTQALGEVTVEFVPQSMVFGIGVDAVAMTVYPSEIWVSDELIHTPGQGPVFVANHSRHRNFEELLVHELAHVLDFRLGYPSNSPEWNAAVRDAPCRITQYAHDSPVEHFAEALSAYLQFYAGRDTLGEHRWVLQSRLGMSKFRYFGSLLSPAPP